MQDQPGKGVGCELGVAEAQAVSNIDVEAGMAEVDFPEVGTNEVGTNEVGTTKIGVLEDGVAEIGASPERIDSTAAKAMTDTAAGTTLRRFSLAEV